MIRNEAAYEAGKLRNIRLNARKTRQAAWQASNPDHAELTEWLFAVGEFDYQHVTKDPALQAEYDAAAARVIEQFGDHCSDLYALDEAYGVRVRTHPLVAGIFTGNFGEFLLKLRDDLTEYGGLSDAQSKVVRDALARARARLAENAAKTAERKAQDAATSGFIGVEGKRIELSFTVNKILTFEGQYGTTYIHLCKDAAGNVIVYKGSKSLGEGAWSGKATIKAHEVRDGVSQTIIARPA